MLTYIVDGAASGKCMKSTRLRCCRFCVLRCSLLSVCECVGESVCDLGHRTISTGEVTEFVHPCNRIGMGGVWLYLFLGPGVQAMHQKLLDPGGLQ